MFVASEFTLPGGDAPNRVTPLIYFAAALPPAKVAELVDARDLGSRAARRASSSLAFRTNPIRGGTRMHHFVAVRPSDATRRTSPKS